MSDRVVLDSSAVLAFLDDEPGGEQVAQLFERASISSVNLSEVVAKLTERGAAGQIIDETLHDLDLDVVAFDAAQATVAGKLRATTRAAGLSLGDRACLALALDQEATAVTTDRAWSRIDIGVTIDLLR